MTKRQEPETKNSSMASNLDEIKQLGKQMKTMRTNQHLKKKGKEPDPVQHQDK